MKKRAFFLDWNGVIFRNSKCSHPCADDLVPEAAEALSLIGKTDFDVIVISNKAGIAKGHFTENDVLESHRCLDALLSAWKIPTPKAYYYCPHHHEGILSEYSFACDCRKPSPGMFFRAAEDHQLNLADSWFVGDKISDIHAGRAAGLKHSVLVRTGAGRHYETEANRLGAPIMEHILQVAMMCLRLEE